MHDVLNKIKFYVSFPCNEKCIYCPIHSDIASLEKKGKEISADLIGKVSAAAVSMGYPAVKFSAEYGDPLLRKDLAQMVASAREAGARDISVATNGLTLERELEKLISAGVNKFCISLDTLSASKYQKVTGVDGVDRVTSSIRRAASKLGSRVKINMVILKGMNDNEIQSMRRFAKEVGATLQLIELFKVKGREKSFRELFFSLSKLAAELKREAVAYSVYKPRASELFELANGERVEITSMRKFKKYHFGPARILVHPNGAVANYDVRLTGVTVTEHQDDKAIKAALIAASKVTIADVGRRGVQAWYNEGPRVS